jgi:Right handed beta helix region
MQGDGACADARQCTLHENGQLGAYVGHGGTLRMAECHLSHNGGTGLEVAGATAHAELAHCQVHGNAVADAYVHAGGRLALSGSSVGNNGKCALLCGGRDDDAAFAASGERGGLIECSAACDVHGRVVQRGVGRIVSISAHFAPPGSTGNCTMPAASAK